MDKLTSNRTLLKIAIPMIGMGAFLLGLAVFAAINVHQQQQLSSELVSREVNGMLTIQELNQTVREIRYLANMFLRIEDTTQLREALALDSTALEQLAKAQELARTPKEQELIAAAAAGYSSFRRQFQAAAEGVLGRLEVGQRRMELTDAETAVFTQLSDDIVTKDVLLHLRECLDANKEVVDRTDAASRETAQHLKIGFILLGICGCVAGLLTGIAITQALGRSMVQLQVSVRSLAGRLTNVTGPVTLSRTTDLAGIEWDLRSLEQDILSIVERLHQRESELLRSEQLARVGQMVAGLAHELRNPLMPMKMLVQAAMEKDPATGLKGRPLEVVNEEIARLEHSIQMFLDFARAPAPEKVWQDVREVVQATVQLVRGRARQQRVELDIEVPSTPVSARVDRHQLRQLLLNLVLNALDAVPQGGKVSIAVDADAPAPVQDQDKAPLPAISLLPAELLTEHDALRLSDIERLTSHSGSSWIAIRVADNGPGIPEEMRDTLFEPFVTTKASGTGLGLSICRHIAAAHGGMLQAHNRTEGGAEFVVYLPRNEA